MDFPNNDRWLTGTDEPWPSAGETDDVDWQARFEHELQEEFPEFDIEFERRAKLGNETRHWLAQCQSCGGTLETTGPILLRNAIRRHMEVERREIA